MTTKQSTFAGALRATTALASAATAALVVAATASAQDAPPVEPEVSDVITVRGQFIPNEKRDTSEISSLLDEDDFALQGDGDVAAALRRVTGLSLSSDSKFVFARGLNERYTNATLNGSPLPSPEPLRRTVPLDILPTAVLASALAQKTYAPEFNGEFGGAALDLRTRAVPVEGFFTIGTSVGYRFDTTGEDGLLYDGGDADWTGFDDGTRNLPPALGSLLGVQSVSELDGADEVAAALELVGGRSDLLVQQRGEIAPDFSVSASGGDRYDLNDWLSIGVLASAGYNNKWQTQEGRSGTAFGDGTLTITEDFDELSTKNEISSNAFFSLGADLFDNHELTGVLLGARVTDKETRTRTGFTETRSTFQRRDNQEWVERQVWTSQVSGTHYFPDLADLELSWRGSYSEAFRDSPYEIAVIYDTDVNGVVSGLSNDATANIDFSKVEDDSTDFGLDLNLPADFFGVEWEFKGGYAYTENDRDARQSLYRIDYPATVTTTTDEGGNTVPNRVDGVLLNFATTPGFDLFEQGGQLAPEAYLATLEVDAVYAGFDAQVTPNLRVALGGRYEDAIQVVDTIDLLSDDTNFVETVKEEDYFLPAATLTYTLPGDQQIRLAASETIIRPQFRELAPTIYLDTDTDISFTGNPFLVDTELFNLDARWEWYFARDEFLTLGLFYKELENPIEEVTEPDGNEFRTTFINVPQAYVRGFEGELNKLFALENHFDNRFLASKDVFFKVNYTYADSEVPAEGTVITRNGQLSQVFETGPISSPAAQEIQDGEPLVGQSEHLANLQIGYEDFESRSTLALLVNYASERVRSRALLATQFAPAIIEQPPLTVDLTYSREFDALGSTFEFGFKAQNILDEDYEAFVEGDFDFLRVGNVAESGSEYVVESYNIGRAVSVSLTSKF